MRRHPLHKRFSQQAAQKRTVHLHHVWKIKVEHVADRLFHQRVISTSVENAIATQKVQIRLIIHIEEICALSTGIDFVETDDALCCHERAVYVPLVQLIIFAETRGDNLFQIESHEEQNFSDSSWERKCQGRCAAPSGHRSAMCLLQKKLQDSDESCSSILRI